MDQTRKPFVIWTLQRTGSTTLARTLQSHTGERVLHEPFGRNRPFAAVAQVFQKDSDSERARAELHAALAERPSLKICIEVHQKPFIDLLLTALMERGYGHAFLTRASLPRLLSFQFAKKTKIWGPKGAKANRDKIEAFPQRLPVKKLVEREKKGLSTLRAIRESLVAAGIDAPELSFETLYLGSEDAARAQFEALLRGLGHSREDAALSESLKTLRQSGEQMTRDQYDRFEGIEKLKTALETVAPF